MAEVLQLLRPGLLTGRRVALAEPARAELRDALATLGADLHALEAEPGDDAAADASAAAAGPVEALVVDAAARFAASRSQDAELAGLRAAADGSWAAARAVANAAWIRPDGTGVAGKLVLVAPAPGAGRHAEAARAALENTARTLSIEWSRFGIRTVAVTPGPRTGVHDVAALVAFLVSPGGDYFSGCRLDLA